jgi:putative addiction module killer protein
MYTIKRTEEFAAWFDGIKDRVTRQRFNARLRKASLGNLGDVRPLGEGVYEMREHFGPGWRMYYALHQSMLIVMLGGGDKSTQSVDVAKAKELASRLRAKHGQKNPN